MEVINKQLNTSLVLAVDDSASCVLLARALLEKLGYKCLTATRFLDACELASRYCPATALVDLVMPEGNGALLSAELHKRCPGIKTFAVSGNYPVDLEGVEYACGRFSAGLAKPLSLTELSRLLGLRDQAAPQVSGLQSRLQSLPLQRRASFVEALLLDLDEVATLMHKAQTRTQVLHCVHRLGGIFSAAAADETSITYALERKLKQGTDLDVEEINLLHALIGALRTRLYACEVNAG